VAAIVEAKFFFNMKRLVVALFVFITDYFVWAGNHTASIQNFIGSGNQVNVNQTGSGNHTFTATNPWNATNNGNTINATQSGGAGADKTFNLYFSGANNAGVTIQQTNPTTPDQAGMNIQCNPCGSGWSYIKF
jgi:hypothetical protein